MSAEPLLETNTPDDPVAGAAAAVASANSSANQSSTQQALPDQLSPDPVPAYQALSQQGSLDAPSEAGAQDVSPIEDAPAAAAARARRPLWLRLPDSSGLIATIVAMATVIALAALLIGLRGPILAALPASAGFYGIFGLLPDPLGAGLEIRDVASARAREGSTDVLTVSGVVANITGGPADVPSIRVSLYDAGDRELQFVDLPSTRTSLASAETMNFDVQIPDPQPGARRVRVGFTAPPDPSRR